MYLNIISKKWFSIFGTTRIGITKKKRDKKIIATLTTFPARINTVWITIETIMRQSIKPDEIILWLAKDQFDGMDSLPDNLTKLCSRGLTIKFCDDLKSYKKFYYTFKHYPNDLVITFDDDMFYPKNTISTLLKLSRQYPNDTISITAQSVPEDLSELPSEWCFLSEQAISSNRAQAYTGSGTLFHPNMYDKLLFEKYIFQDIAPLADDLWMYAIGLVSNIKVTTPPKYHAFPITIWNTNEHSLFSQNGANGGNMNDVQWANIIDQFKDKLTK